MNEAVTVGGPWANPKAFRWIAIGATLLYVAQAFTGEQGLPTSDRVAGVVVFLLFVAAIEDHLRNRDRRPLPIIPLVMANYALTYAWFLGSDNAILDPFISPGLGVVVLLSVISLLVGIRAARWAGSGRMQGYALGPQRLKTVEVYLWVLIGIGLVDRWTPLGGRFSTLDNVSDTAFAIGSLSLWFLSVAGELPARRRVALWTVLAVMMLRSIAAGQLALGFVMLVQLGMIYYIVRRRAPLAAAVIMLVALLPLAAVKGAYRTQAGGVGVSRSFSAAAGFVGLAADAASDMIFRPSARTAALTIVGSRLGAGLSALGLAHRDTPKFVPYLGGGSLVPLLVKPIPRLFWPGKPREDQGSTFGHRYGVLSADDDVTSVNISWSADLFMNFGLAGIIGGFLILGFLLGWLLRFFEGPKATEYTTIIGIMALSPFTFQDSNISMQVGGLIILAPVALACGRLLGVLAETAPTGLAPTQPVVRLGAQP